MSAVTGVALDRAGIFKVIPYEWSIQPPKEGSRAIAVHLAFVVKAQLGDENEWVSWEEAETHTIHGWYYVTKKDGAINAQTVEQLAVSLGWNGDLRAVTGQPPDVVVQVQVKEDTYGGKTTYKAGWMNPGDYVPTGGGGASTDDVNKLQAQFGSLLRAAAAGAAKTAAKPAAPKKAAPPAAKAKPTGIADARSVPPEPVNINILDDVDPNTGEAMPDKTPFD